jgi:hypothetical protein
MVLAALAPAGAHRRRAWVLIALTIFGLWMALGIHGGLYPFAKTMLPPLGFIRYPVKFVIIAVFTIPVLGGLGLHAALSNAHLWRRLIHVAIVAAALILLIAAIAWRAPVLHETSLATALNGLVRLIFLGGFLFLLRQWLKGGAPRLAWVVAAGLAGLVMADNLTHMPRQNPTAPVAAFQPAEGLFESKPKPGESRACIHPWVNQMLGYATTTNALQYCYRNRQALFCNWNLVDDVAKINGFFSLYAREQAQLLAPFYTATNRLPDALLDFLAVTNINSVSNWFSMEPRPSAMSLVSIGQQPVFFADTQALARVISPEFQPRTEVLLPAETASQVKAEADPQARAQLIHFDAHHWTITVTAEKPTLLVAAQTYYPHWQATVDGQPVSLWRANYAFQAVAVPSGRHTVELRYVDRSFRIGMIISIASLVLVLFAIAWPSRPGKAHKMTWQR